jgi:prolyl oligopeptidase
MAYLVQRGGSDWTTVYVRNATNGKDLSKDVLKWIKFSGVTWTQDSKGFFYSRFDNPGEGNMDKAA